MNAILIPAYQPDDKLVVLVKELKALGLDRIVVVDDGSRAACAPVFEAVEKEGAKLVRHPVNQGKGAAIKTALSFASQTMPECAGYVTCDADGQHLAKDILKVSEELAAHPEALVLGSRDLTAENVPRQSRFGNAFSSFYFKAVTGVACKDTQTGLRGIPKALVPLAMELTENRYDYEMTFLTRAAREGTPLVMVPIETVYIEKNAASHFRPVIDSIRIYKEPLKFALSSLFCTGVDLLLFTLLSLLPIPDVFRLVAVATIVARLVSGILNFLLNRHWSFRNKASFRRQFTRYFLLYLFILSSSILLVTLLEFLPFHITFVKVMVDGSLAIVSFLVQKKWVFAHPRRIAR